MLDAYDVLLLDMNNTFMFDADRFSPEQDYDVIYRALEGEALSSSEVNRYITDCYERIMEAYYSSAHHEAFPQVREILAELGAPEGELTLLEETFAHYEQGYVPGEYAQCLRHLAQSHRLGLICNLWSPKHHWQDYLQATGLWDLFEILVFSSDYTFMKPSPKIFDVALQHFGVPIERVVHIGDSHYHDVQGAHNTGLDSVWIQHDQTLPDDGPRPTHILPSLLALHNV